MKRFIILLFLACFVNKVFGDPLPQRGLKYINYLSASVLIKAGDNYGSGTIIYYDAKNNNAYVASCGHLWDENSSADCKIVVWYHNKIKLLIPRTYKAKVLFWSLKPGQDSSCVVFKPDWKPKYFSIAPNNYKMNPGKELISTGCDFGDEVAVYSVEFIEQVGGIISTRLNSPRSGRSGGGLLDKEYYVGTCFASNDIKHGMGKGWFTNLENIRAVYKRNGYGWLVNSYSFAQEIPIIDYINPGRRYPKSYIILP
jgi:hypothetical protein